MTSDDFPKTLSCPKCEQMSRRVFDGFLSEEALKHSEVSVSPKITNYILLNWICCVDNKCAYFARTSRCPVCSRWSVKLSLKNVDDKFWKCLNKECGWNFSIRSRR